MSGSFLDDIAFGRHVEGDSPLHRAWPAGKAFIFCAVAVAAFFLHSATAFLGLGLLLGLLARVAGVPHSLFWRSLRPVYLLALFTVLAWATINHPQASPLHPVFSWQGLHTGGLYAARLMVITLLTTLFLLTTRPDQAVNLGIKLLTPFRLLGIDQHELSLLVHLAYRFVPLLRREIREVQLGKKARNLPPPRGIWARARAATDSLVFLFVGALHRAETTSYALEDRDVLETWQHQETGDNPRGSGGWMLLSMVVLTAILLWKDQWLW